MSRDRYKVHDPLYPHFFTCTVVRWLPVFTRPECAEIVLDSLRFLHTSGRLTLFAYVLLENHLHLIAVGEHPASEIGKFKSFTARRVIDFLHDRAEDSLLDQLSHYKRRHKTDRQYQLWQEGSHPIQIVEDTVMEQKIDYVHNNPAKRGYVDEPTHWRYSSARDYHAMTGLVPVVTDWKNDSRPAPATAPCQGRDAERPVVRYHAERGNEEV